MFLRKFFCPCWWFEDLAWITPMIQRDIFLTSTFCQFVVKAKEGKVPSGNGRAARDDNKVAALVNDIKNFLDHRDRYDYGAIERMLVPIHKLKNAEIEAIGQQIRCPVKGKKTDMIKELQNWLTNIKASDVQSSFSLVGSGVAANGY